MTQMTYRPLGASGLMVSTVGLGCNNIGSRLDAAQTQLLVDAALDAGITLFDTADVYGNRGGSETLLGAALRGRRAEVVLASKFGMDMGGALGADHGARGSRRYLRRAVEASLTRLATDHLDLYQYHAPDGITPLAETLAALDELVTEGKIRYAGSSNLAAWQVAEAEWTSRVTSSTRFISAQNHYSLLERGLEPDVGAACVAYGIGLLPYYPLANGLLSGKYRQGRPLPTGTRLSEPGRGEYVTEPRLAAVERLADYADERGRSLLDVAIGGLAAQPAVSSVIAGARTPEQVRANAAAAAWVPSPQDLTALDAVVAPGR